MGFLPPSFPLSASPLEFEILRGFRWGSVTQGTELWRGSREELPVLLWPSMCYLQGPHLSLFSLAGNDSVLNSVITFCSFPHWGLCKNSFYVGNKLVLEPFWGWRCINIRYLLLLFVAQGISRKRLGTSNAQFYRQKIAVGKTTWCAEHNVLIQRTELSFPGSHEHKTPGAHISWPFTYFENKRPLPWPVKPWSPWTSVRRLGRLSLPASVG